MDRATINDVHLIKDLKPLAKEFNMKLLRNKEKNAHIRAIASILLKKERIKVTAPLESITRDDVQIFRKWLDCYNCKSMCLSTSTLLADLSPWSELQTRWSTDCMFKFVKRWCGSWKVTWLLQMIARHSVNKHCVSWLITLVWVDKVVNWLHVWVWSGYFVANMLLFVALGYYTTRGNCVGWVYKNYLHMLYNKYPLKIGEH